MGYFGNIFKSSDQTLHALPSKVDVHSHLVPGIDDGSQSLEESVMLIREMMRLGYSRAITTPHIMTDAFDNNRDNIMQGLDVLNAELLKQGIDFPLDAAAEYYLDEFFLKKISREKLLTFGKNYVLIETGTMNSNRMFKETVFELKVAGYEPVLAHPERYSYLWTGKKSKDNYTALKDMELIFQLNLISLGGFYSPQVKKIAEMLIRENMVEMIGTDLHEQKFITAIETSLKNKYIDKLLNVKLLNDTLFS